MRAAIFIWDSSNRAKCTANGLSILDIEKFFLSRPIFCFDFSDDTDEDRRVAYGDFEDKFIVCTFTFKVINDQLNIRVIGTKWVKRKWLEDRRTKNKKLKNL